MLLQELSCFQRILYDRDHTRVDVSGFQIEVDYSSIESHLHFLLRYSSLCIVKWTEK